MREVEDAEGVPAVPPPTTGTTAAAIPSFQQPPPPDVIHPGSVLSEAATALLGSNKSKRRALGASLESLLAAFSGTAAGSGGDASAANAAGPSSSSSLLLDPRFAQLVRRARAQRAALFALGRGVPLSAGLMAAVDGVEVGGGDVDGDGEPYFYSEPSGALRAAASRPPRSLLSAPAESPALTAEDVAAVRRLAADRDRSRLRAAAAEASRAASAVGGTSSASDRSARVLLSAEARLAMLLRARALKLAPRQQALRSAVLADERRARAVLETESDDGDGDGGLDEDEDDEPSGDPSLFLAEFSRWRIAAPWQLGAPEHVPKPPRATAETQEAAAHQAKSEYKHLLRLGAQAAKSMTQAERRAAAAAAAAAAAQAKRQRQEDAKRARAEANAELEAMRAAAAASGGFFASPAAANHFQQLSAAAAAREAEAAALAAKERAEQERLDRALRVLEAERVMLEQRANLVFEAASVLRNPDPERGLRARRNAEDRRRAQRNTWARSWHGREQRRIAREGAARVAALKGADYGEYLRLARLAKDSRLNELLSRTDAIVDTLRSRVPEQRAEAADVAAKKKKARKADRKYKRERKKRLGIFKKGRKGGGGGGGGGEGEEGGDGGGGGDAAASDSSSSSEEEEEEQEGNIEEINNASADAAFEWEADDDAAEAADDAAEEEGLDDDTKHLLRTHREYYRGVHAIRDRNIAQPKLVTGGELRSYQVAGLRFMASLVNNKVNGILADEMGLGKTVQTIALVAHLLERNQLAGPHLILAPKAVLPNWSAEFTRWAPGLTAVLYDGAPEQRRAIREKWLSKPRSFHALLTHYDLAMRDARALRSLPGGWGLLVVDEGHRLKNADARLATALRSLTAAHRILLTGTPLQNSLAELWALLNFVLPKVFDSAASFDEWFAAPLGDGGGGPGMASPSAAGNSSAAAATPLTEEEQLLVITRLHQVLRPFVLRRTKAEVESDLPDKTSRVVRCRLSAWQAAWYRQIARKGRATLGSSSGSGSSSGGGGGAGGGGMMRGGLRNIAMQLRKVCIHPYLFLDNPNSSYSCGLDYSPADPEEVVRASGKVALLDSVLEKLKATGHRVLLFSQMTRALDVLGDFLDLRGHRHLRLDGSTKTEDRARLLAEFNAPDSPFFVFLLSTRAGGLGLNLQSADTVIMFDSDWNPASDAQAEDRAHRIGQTKDVLVLVLCSAGTIEEVILDRAARKRELDAKVIQAGMFNDASTHRERTRALQALLAAGDPGGGAGGGGDAAGATSAAAINKAIARGPEELAVFKGIDARRRAQAKGRPPLLTATEIPEFARSLLGGPEEDPAEGGGGEDPKAAAARRREELREEAAADAEAAAAGRRRSRRAKPAGGVSYREPGDDDFAFSDSDEEGKDAGPKEDDDDEAGASEIESLLDSEESDEEAELRAKAKAAARRARKAEEKKKKSSKGKGKVGEEEDAGEDEGDDDEDEDESEDEEDLEVHAPVKRGRGRPPKNAAAAAAAAAASAPAKAKAKGDGGKRRAATATPAAESEEEEAKEEEEKSKTCGATRGGGPSSAPAPAASKRSRLPSVEEQPAAAAAAGRRSGRSGGGREAAAAATAKAKKNAAAPASAPRKGASSPPAPAPSDKEEPPAKRGRARPPVSYKE